MRPQPPLVVDQLSKQQPNDHARSAATDQKRVDVVFGQSEGCVSGGEFARNGHKIGSRQRRRTRNQATIRSGTTTMAVITKGHIAAQV